MTRLAFAALLPLLWATPAAAEQMDMNMPGMNMSGMSHAHARAGKKARPAHRHAPAAAAKPAGRASATAGHQGTPGMPSMPGMETPATHAEAPGANTMPGMSMPGHTGAGMADMASAAPAEPPIPATPPPPPAKDYLADRYYDPAAMAASRHMMRMEMGGTNFSKVMLNLAEHQSGAHGEGYRWDGQAWFGGDINRLVLRSEGEGRVKEGIETSEVQGLYSRAVGRYLDVQGGVRQDFSPRARTYLTLGAQSLLPYWFDVEGALFLSTRGELLARAEGTYDLRLFQRVVLQPRAELNFAAQDRPRLRTGSGLSDAELGLRLRYEIRREFAPYVGVSWARRFGKTADYWRVAGDAPESTTFVVGLRAWF